ncbi:hypothetical protein F4677DRAFT_351961 [Hypoxylon crocopeplum]|nr:hypothetical protein F4677DRAFT_351961 [Hypoxylon crocopeplum]
MTQVGVRRKTRPIYIASTKIRKCEGNNKKLMSTNETIYNYTIIWSLDSLTTELLALIFEQLRYIDSRALGSARQVSRRFEAIVTPILFNTTCLNQRMIAPQAETYFPRGVQNMYSLTRHVEVRSDLDPVNTRRVLDRIQRLSSLKWRYVGTSPHSGFFSTPLDILGPQHIKANQIRLYVEDLPLRDTDSDSHDAYLRAIPPRNLVSLKMTSPTPPLTTSLESLKRLLLKAHRLEAFHYNDRGQGTRFSFKEGERLPALKELSLRSYDWNHSVGEVKRHWDFSRLRWLTLIDVPMFQFLSSVPYAELRQLRSLHYEDFSTHLPDRREEATRSLYMLILQIEALHTIKISCRTNLFPINGLLRHADSLRVLSFRDFVGFGDERQRCPTMRAEELAVLSRKLANLHTAELDMDVALCEPAPFLRALCDFPRLETLTLHTQTTVLASDTQGEGSLDRDHLAATEMFSALVRGKRGRPWRRITVNVGGWKPVMVRRMGEAWRALNRQGVFAERCFVLQRDAETGEVAVREEVGVDGGGYA